MNYFTLLDKLDEEYNSLNSYSQKLAMLYASLQSNLENILNTYKVCYSWPEAYNQLDNSILNYGIDDFNTFDLHTKKLQLALCEQIKNSIILFEKRLHDVDVKMVSQNEEINSIIRLKINGILRVGMIHEQIVFNSNLDTSTGKFNLTPIISF